MARLVLNCEGVDLGTHEFFRDIVMIGRAPSNRIVIDHPTVSAQHTVLLKVGNSYWLKDLNSTNGTQINDMLVTDAELKDVAANGQRPRLESSGGILGSKPEANARLIVAARFGDHIPLSIVGRFKPVAY